MILIKSFLTGFCMIVSNLYTRFSMKGIRFANAIAVWKWWYKPIYMLVFSQCFLFNVHHLGTDYITIFNPIWNFNSAYRVEISSRLNSKLLVKMTLQLHVKISTRYTELKFQLRSAKPRWNFIPGWKYQIFHIIDIFFKPG